MRKAFDTAAALLPPLLRRRAQMLPDGDKDRAEELRLRSGVIPTVLLSDGEKSLPGAGEVSPADLCAVLENATGASVHTASDSIRRGFVSVRGGVRVGLCGTAAVSGGGVCAMRGLSSVCIRIPGQAIGCADAIFPELYDGSFRSTLLISPPGAGKTTLLRELVRRLSDAGRRVALSDERGEVAAVWQGRAQLDVGRTTDIITAAPKAESAVMLLRSMNPEILALDEITAPEDAQACVQACGCGVSILATAHGADADALRSRPVYRRLLREGVFSRAVIISRSGSGRIYKVVPL